jgi:heparosan-N-sulfate-glucuronate 5-epimerase
VRARARYLKRVFVSYVLPGTSQLSFWHETPELNRSASWDRLGPYYQTFLTKADFSEVDGSEVPLLDYHGVIGRQHNPIAIAQYGLGNYNVWVRDGGDQRLHRCLAAADWLVANLEANVQGIPVWHHNFDWEYRDTLVAPWYSGLAQGQGISLLHRAHDATGKQEYASAAAEAFRSLTTVIEDGGVLYIDAQGDPWIEEYIVDPPTHILNGFMWALWGVWDHWLTSKEHKAKELFDSCVGTLLHHLHRYDTGYWSLYEQSGTRLPMIASPFYHSLHIVQLEVMFHLTGHQDFGDWAERWSGYRRSRINRTRALTQKLVFKLLYY